MSTSTISFNSSIGNYGNTTSISGNGTLIPEPGATIPVVPLPGLDMVSYFSSHVQSKQVALALLVWVVYDYLLTAADSVNLFWSHRWSISKILYFMSQYMTLVTTILVALEIAAQNPSDAFCYASPWLRLVTSTILILIMNLVLISRIYALWNRSRLLLNLMLIGLLINVAYYFGAVAYMRVGTILRRNDPPFTGCFGMPRLYGAAWTMLVATLVYEAILLALTAVKAYPIAIQRGVKAPLFSLLLYDGLIYFLLIMIVQILNLVSTFQTGSLFAVMLNTSPAFAVMGVCCNRLLLRLQWALVGTGHKNYSEYNQTEVAHDWPIVTFGGSSGRRRRQDAEQTTMGHPPALFAHRSGQAFHRTRKLHGGDEDDDGTVATDQETDFVDVRRGLGEVELELQFVPSEDARDGTFGRTERIVKAPRDFL